MATLLYRIGKTAYRRWPIFLAAWIVAMIGIGTIAATMSKPMTDSFSIPGIPSEEAADLQEELFPDAKGAFDQATVNVVVAAPEGHTLDEPAYSAAVDDLIADLADGPQMPPADQLANPVAADRDIREQMTEAADARGSPAAQARQDADAVSTLSADRRVGLISFDLDVETVTDVEVDTRDAIANALDGARDAGLTAEANGSGMESNEAPGGTSELIGIAVALAVLVLTFGSLVAAGLPIVTALFGLGLGITGITAMTAFMDIGSSTPILATMLGLAVGIDYALFILARYRTELHDTDDREEAIGVAVGTSGSAVVFAGLTVLIALSALAVVGIPFLTAMGLAAAATVFVAVLVALTLLPAVLGLLKSKSFGGRVRRHQPHRDEDGRILNNGVRWARMVGRRPVAAVLLVVVALGALAVPLKDLHLAFPTDSTAPADTTQRNASDLISDAFGPGREAPMLLVVDASDVAEDDRDATFDEIVDWVEAKGGVLNAQVAGTNSTDPEVAPTGAQILVTPEYGPDDSRTEDLLAELRDGQSRLETDTDTDVGVTGLTAIQTDVSERLADALPIYLAIVIGLAFILLMIVFRSILVPLTATLGFLLSVLATLGATVAVFQEGALGLMDGQPIVSFMPIFLIGVVFGLAMDYQVFLVTRVREAFVHGASPREAVVDGFRNSARVVTAAAAIMTSVFAAFMLQDDAIIKSMGFALAAAIIFDAFIVRMVLIPALLYLMGEKAWWLPRWLDRLLPNVDVEGDSLLKYRLRQQELRDLVSDEDDQRDLVSV
jgi:putative drug exporter of the RND superfamily